MGAIGLTGTYHYSVSNFDNTYRDYTVKVEIIDETSVSYKVKVLTRSYNKQPDQILWVSKRKVVLDYNKEITPEYIDTSDYWWNRD